MLFAAGVLVCAPLAGKIRLPVNTLFYSPEWMDMRGRGGSKDMGKKQEAGLTSQLSVEHADELDASRCKASRISRRADIVSAFKAL